jgi:hypothetical protein
MIQSKIIAIYARRPPPAISVLIRAFLNPNTAKGVNFAAAARIGDTSI